ncbi:MAG: outer membrane beta-barrel domain-containing protein [Myxococcota bacterium]
MMNRLMVLVTIAAALVAAEPRLAAAQQVQVTGPLAGEPAVRHMRLYREGRLQLAPVVSFTLQDEFSQTMFTGAQVAYHFVDWLGVGIWGAFGAAHLETNLTDEVRGKGQTRQRNAVSLPSGENFPAQIGELNWAAALQLNFIPLRGKMSLFQKVFVDTDFYIFAGVAAVGVTERADVESDVCTAAPPAGAGRDNPCIATQFASESRVAIAPTFGIGLDFFISDWVAILFEWRGLPFKWNTSGFDVLGGDDKTPDGQVDDEDRVFHFNHMVSLGVSFFLPTDAKVSN